MGVTVPHSRMISPQATKTKIIHLKILTTVGQDFLQGCGFIPCWCRCRPPCFPAHARKSAKFGVKSVFYSQIFAVIFVNMRYMLSAALCNRLDRQGNAPVNCHTGCHYTSRSRNSRNRNSRKAPERLKIAPGGGKSISAASAGETSNSSKMASPKALSTSAAVRR